MEPNSKEFLRLILRGERFAEHVVSFDVLSEFTTYRNLIIDVAKALYFQDHPQRKRVPKGFLDSFHLGLKQVEEGSSVCIIARTFPATPVTTQTSLFKSIPETESHEDLFDRARDYVDAMLRAAEDDLSLPNGIDPNALRRFKHLGKTLHPEDSIEFLSPRHREGPRYTLSTRQKVMAQRGEDYEETLNVTGTLEDVAKANKTFKVLCDGKLMDGEYLAKHENDLLFAYKSYRAVGVSFEATAVHSPNGELKKLKDLHHLTLFDLGPDIENRLDELKELEDGWYHGEGKAVNLSLLSRMSSLLPAILHEYNCPVPYIYPTPEGGIQLEWRRIGKWDVEAVFENTSVDILAHQFEDDIWNEMQFELNNDELAERIGKILEGYILAAERE